MAPQKHFDTDQIKEKARKDILYLLESVRGKKNLVIERDLLGPIGLFVKFQTLQDYGVDKLFFLENNNADTSQRNVVFLARGDSAKTVQSIADQIKRIQRETQTIPEFSIFWIPRRTLVSDQILEEAGVLGDVNISEFPLYFIPLEKDLLSLELGNSFGDIYIRKDPTPTYTIAQALMNFQERHGLFPRIVGKGENAQRVAELLSRMRLEALAGEDSGGSRLGLAPSSSIEGLIVIDREVDLATPLLTQFTYEGLIDEVFSIHNNQIEVDSTVIGAATQAPPEGSSRPAAAAAPQARTKKIILDSSDNFFSKIRDTHVSVAQDLLKRAAKRLRSDYESRNDNMSISEMRDFVKRLPNMQAEEKSLAVHSGLAEEIMKYTETEQFTRVHDVQRELAAGTDLPLLQDSIEELIATNTPLKEVLRILCLASCVAGGIKPRDLDLYKRMVLQAYGYQHILTFDALEKLQLLVSSSSALAGMRWTPGSSTAATRTNFAYLRKSLHLLVNEVSVRTPNDIAYVYGGYAPLSVRLVQCLLQKQYLTSLSRPGAANGASRGGDALGWRGFEESVKHVKGPTTDIVQKGEDKAAKARSLLSSSGEKKTVLVVFLGGITYTEIAALRYVAEQEEARRQLVICTTSIISGNKMMDAAIEKEHFGPQDE